MDIDRAADLQLSSSITFYGFSTPAQIPKTALTADAFISEVGSRRTRAIWNDPQAIRYAFSCFRGEARGWFSTGHPSTLVTQEDRTAFTENWPVFEAAFKAYYCPKALAKTQHWPKVLQQQTGEEAWTFLARAQNEWGKWFETTFPAEDLTVFTPDPTLRFEAVANGLILHPIIPPVAAAVGQPPAPPILPHEVQVIMVEQRRLLVQQMNQAILQAVHLCRARCAMHLIPPGLHSAELRKLAVKRIDENVTPAALLSELMRKSQAEKITQVNKLGANDSDDKEDNCNTVGKGKKKPKYSNGGPCTFCRGRHHSAEVCRQKKAADKKKKSAGQANAAPAAAAPAVPVAAANAVAASASVGSISTPFSGNSGWN